ncbi:DUF3135 domain-containing protein [Vibrio sp. JPW-9-11-11]|uniref:DUF3135 domain-containing protein n=1 Tax=Vibrio sp. JPW-9-11-11 TaxID=1416532 RepID=UPI001594BAFE|nr:DUF3135 domain-containing protein [Vibrio sp. JPW-9-11-11]NVD05406.1 DUF3135 domain-containing protein [Vibrio sp. JPW-9-11-11]
MQSPLINQTLPSFDELMAMAESSPDAFNRFKQEMCEEMIQSASVEMQDRLWAQQSHIDRVLSKCKNPNQANVVLMRELVSQMVKFQDVLDSDGSDLENKPIAEVIPFDSWR